MKSIQYTLREVPAQIDRELRARAKRDHMSLNAVALRTLSTGLGLTEHPPCFTDLDSLAGSWVNDPAVEDALADMRKVDEDLWR